jgi:uncharacterized LabA/DUF88 family protein
MRRIYVYVDGESHYAMSEKCMKRAIGKHALMENLTHLKIGERYQVFHNANAKLFWCGDFLDKVNIEAQLVARSVYFTVYHGQNTDLHTAKTYIRTAGFEPWIVHEQKDLAKQRDKQLQTDGILTKPKGVDIALAARMLKDAPHYDECVLATSDVDYYPVVEAVRQMGKNVYILAYHEGIAKDSPFFYVVERLALINEDTFKEMFRVKEREEAAGVS